MGILHGKVNSEQPLQPLPTNRPQLSPEQIAEIKSKKAEQLSQEPPSTEAKPTIKESVNIQTPTAQAGAATSLAIIEPKNSEEAIQAWRAAGKASPALDFSEANNPGEVARVLLHHAPEDDKGRRNLAEFMRDMLHADYQLLDLFTDYVQEQGLTPEQMDLIAQGEFTAQDFEYMAKDGGTCYLFSLPPFE